MSEYKRFNITGPISVERVDDVLEAGASRLILLMGLTGVGKSSFIEAFLDTSSTLDISGDDLEGVTQEIVAYRLVNIVDKYNEPIHLIDTPGFADRKISEMRIVKLVQEWLKAHDLLGVTGILYFDRISDIRIAGSKRRGLEMFKDIAGADAAKAIVIATTMWDCLWKESSIERANSRYQQMQDTIWKDFVEGGSRITKFENTRESALDVLDLILDQTITPDAIWFEFENMARHEQAVRDSRFAQAILRSLVDRHQALIQRHLTLEEELRQLSGSTSAVDMLLQAILQQEKSEVERFINIFEGELADFGEPPGQVNLPMQMEEVPQQASSSKGQAKQGRIRTTIRRLQKLLHLSGNVSKS
ncbi:P-loop containing nucleoside triphosphate hydrolase protein [Panaeolus papilionaceus]|nr:P-loop containing nucleoside triphosphate hydrolase protein [Panaeolus papilionaceus]